MGKPHPKELRERVVAHVMVGNTHHSAAARFDVSIKFVNDMVKLKRETGSLAPKRQGNPGHRQTDAPRRLGARAGGNKRRDHARRDDRAAPLGAGHICCPQLGLAAFPAPWADAQKKTFRRLSRSAPKWRESGVSGSCIASLSWRICWNASAFWTRPG